MRGEKSAAGSSERLTTHDMLLVRDPTNWSPFCYVWAGIGDYSVHLFSSLSTWGVFIVPSQSWSHALAAGILFVSNCFLHCEEIPHHQARHARQSRCHALAAETSSVARLPSSRRKPLCSTKQRSHRAKRKGKQDKKETRQPLNSCFPFIIHRRDVMTLDPFPS